MVTRAKFVQAIRDFKKKHGGKLKDLLNEKSNPEAVKAFWSDPVIQAYLARPSVTFVDKHPQLRDSTTKEEHDVSDHYELKIYKYLPNAVVYRNNDIISPKFYTSGTSILHHDLFSKLLRAFSQESSDIEVGSPRDIYEIASRPIRRFLTVQGTTSPRFLIHLNWKDQHASACITILDPVTRRQLITLFINSWQSKDYYEYLKKRFFMARYQSFGSTRADLKERVKNYLSKTFSIDVDGSSLPTQPPSLLINKEEGAAFTINYSSADYHSEAYEAIERSPEIETIYSFTMEDYEDLSVPELSMRHAPKTLFIDASHHLQLAVDDQNCVLYSMNFIQAMVEMLKQSEVADRVFELARTVKSDPSAIKTLVHIFQEDLKAYLPCYYDTTTRMPKSRSELEIFHLNQRWEIGRKSLSILHPVEQPVSIEAPIDASSHTSEKTVIKPSSLEDHTPLNTAVKLDLLIEQDIKDQSSLMVLPSEATKNDQVVELSIQDKEDSTAQNNETHKKSALISPKIEFFQKTQAMHDYGVLLRDQGTWKGQVAIDLASKLTTMANEFFDKEPEQRNFAEFEPRFSALLHSKDKEMSAYRISWGTIVANIAIAFTGVGLLFIAGKLIHSKVTENRALFFFQKSKTTSEEKIADVEHAASLIAQSA